MSTVNNGREVFDFSNALVRSHAIYYVVTEGKTKTPKQKYDYFQAILACEVEKYDEMGERKQGMANGLKKAAKIAGLEYEISQLESKKHIDPLPTGARSYLKRLYGFLKYGKWSASKEKGNKYTDKGKLAEPDAIALLNFLDNKEYVKNEERFENAFLSGVPDIIDFSGEKPLIVDVKCSWDWETFAENIGKPLNPLYWWQMQGYLSLKDIEQGEVSYCLVDTPGSILQEELYRLAKRMDAVTEESPEYRLAEAMLINNLTFSDIPAVERRLKFEVKRDDEAIAKIHAVIPKCREYLFELQEMHLTGYFKDSDLPMLEEIEEI